MTWHTLQLFRQRLVFTAQFRVDFRIYFTPTPNDVIRATGPSVIHGWLLELVPAAGFSYVF